MRSISARFIANYLAISMAATSDMSVGENLPSFSEPELRCDQVFNVARAAAANPTVSSQRAYLWNGGGSGGLGNTFVGFIGSWYDAMRSGRLLFRSSTSEFVFNDLSMAFDLGVPVLDPLLEFGTSDLALRKKNVYPSLYPVFEKAAPFDALLEYHAGQIQSPVIDASHVQIAQSRYPNIFALRPRNHTLVVCMYKAVGCAPPPKPRHIPLEPGALVLLSDEPRDYCAETQALRHLIQGLSPRLLRVASIYEGSWSGSQDRLRSLIQSRTPVSSVSLKPIWDIALHLRVQFPFVEQGLSEVGNEDEVQEWLELTDTAHRM